ncbi:hypothetical protein LJC01_00635 [Clostridiaceae bacterium OttesenSCG-928-D20]|nr:hypothetical protein [Clostridiaceae bacterium OttesenSCG-928-D20]
MSENFDYELAMKSRPHVVILGAGASCAAIPNGDKNGHYISAMKGFVEKLGLANLIEEIDLTTDSDNLEDIYMEIDERSQTEMKCYDAKVKLQDAIRDYMATYELPDEPTVYDYLVLSMTSKDLIATFNWDPMLMQAYERAHRITNNLPQLAFLHGNVAIGFCEEHDVIGWNGFNCRCGKPLTSVDLLYPIKEKEYTSNAFIEKEWGRLQHYMKHAYMVTVFGYSAPKSDVAAIELMKQAWGDVNSRNLEEIEIVDLCNEDEVLESWNKFIHTHHYAYHNDFLETTLGKCPRRSCEATFDRLMNVRWLSSNGFKKSMTFADIIDLLSPLLNDERMNEGKMLNNPYLA